MVVWGITIESVPGVREDAIVSACIKSRKERSKRFLTALSNRIVVFTLDGRH